MKYSSKMERCGLSPMRKFNGEAAKAVENGKKIYHLNIGQPDIVTPAAYFDALKAFAQPVLAYAPSPGVGELLDAVRAYYARIGVQLERSEIYATTGGSEALQMAMAAILDDGDEIVIPEPFYPNYHTSVTLAGATIRPVTTCPEEGYRYAVRERVEACINERTRAIMITNPGNPTGAVLEPEELKLMLDIAKEHDLLIVCDEVYREFVYDGEPLMSALQFEGYEQNVVVIDSVSKRFSACGARIGMLISRNKALMAEALKFCQGRLCTTTLEQVGAAALYSVGPEYFEKVREEYRRRRDLCYRKLTAIPGVVCAKPMGAFYVMAKLPIDDADEFMKWMLTDFEDHGETVMCSPAAGFYATPGRGKNEIRIAYVLKEKDLDRALDLLALGIEAYNKR